MRTADLYWLAGLMEGEGCFGCYPIYDKRRDRTRRDTRVQLGMSDLDVVERARALMGIRSLTHRVKPNERSTKPYYTLTAVGARALGIMQTLYPLLGSRRRAKIREILDSAVRR